MVSLSRLRRVLHQLLRGVGVVAAPRTPSMAVPNPPTLRSPMLGRSPMFGAAPAHSPANSSSTAGTRTPGTWTPTIMSPSSPAFPAYPSSNSNSNAAGGSAHPYRYSYPNRYPLSSGGFSAAAAASAARDGGSGSGGIGGGGIGGGGIGSAFDATSGQWPLPLALEENAVRKALGLPLLSTGSADQSAHETNHRRRGPSQVNSQSVGAGRQHREDSVGGNGFDEHDGAPKGEGGGRTESERRCSQMNQAPGRAPLCLLLSSLGVLFRWDAAAAADICADAFPGVRPW